MNRIYCDIAATTPIDSTVLELMTHTQNNVFGNPSSVHRFGQEAKAVVERARKQVAKSLQANSSEIIFTSGGSESNNIVLQNTLKSGDHFVTSSFEHPSILNTARFLESKGVETTLVSPSSDGSIDEKYVFKACKSNTKLISIMGVNNELGTINPIREIGEFCRNNDILFHSDLVQMFGKSSFEVSKTPIDFISLAGHKIYGPKGVGVLYLRNGMNLPPLIYGGGQESNLRAGTENVDAIAGFGLASELAIVNIENNTNHVKHIENHFLSVLEKSGVQFKLNGKNRVPGICNLTFYGVNGQSLLINLDIQGIAISFGSACSSGSMKASKTLLEIGMSESDALNTVRISFGKHHSIEEVEMVANAVSNQVQMILSDG
jgi:cysteine desulfurase